MRYQYRMYFYSGEQSEWFDGSDIVPPSIAELLAVRRITSVVLNYDNETSVEYREEQDEIPSGV